VEPGGSLDPSDGVGGGGDEAERHVGCRPVDDSGLRVAGVDGCHAGWVVVVASPPVGTGEPVRVASVGVVGDLAVTFDEVAAARLAAVALDMPIGLPEAGPRACDIQARARLGPRRASVFPAPVRAVLAAVDYDDALRRSRAASGRGLSLQSWYLVPRIAEVDRWLAGLAGSASESVAARADAVYETHPELAFAELAGAPMQHPKRSRPGRLERLAALRGRVAPRWLRPTAVPTGAAPDDVLDALVLAVRAAGWVDGSSPPLELGDGSFDSLGRPMRVRG
jgi:predicted RNase H-like nuclease